MKKNDVKVGGHYAAKVTGKMATVRIDRENPHGGWDATNLRTNKSVRIKSAQRLRGRTRAPGSPPPGSGEPAESVAAIYERTARKPAAGPVAAPAQTSPAQDRPVKAGVTAKAKRPGGLDAAAQVLAEAGGPLGCKEMVERMLAKGLWKTGGKTPWATIYAAIIREIAAKGDQSRFRKTERGKFEMAG